MSVNFVRPEEVYYFVESIRPFELTDIGSEKWLYVHEMIVKLSHQACLEAAEHREEMVKDMLICRGKINVLMHEAYCVNLWKTRVLPFLLEVNPNPQSIFLIYTVLHHEGSLMSLLNIALYHSNGCEALQDSAVDLVDYCAKGLSQLIGLVCTGHHENDSNQEVDESILTEMERQKRDSIYLIGLRCISIACYLTDNAAALPLSAQKRMVTTHDLPCLIVDILNFRPWEKKTKKGIEKFINDKWEVVQGEALLKLVKYEAQAWLCLLQLLFNNNLMQSYIFTEQRRTVLGKCLGMLNDCLLDQLPPLIRLKQYLCQLSMSVNTPLNAANKASLLFEMTKMKENLIQATAPPPQMTAPPMSAANSIPMYSASFQQYMTSPAALSYPAARTMPSYPQMQTWMWGLSTPMLPQMTQYQQQQQEQSSIVPTMAPTTIQTSSALPTFTGINSPPTSASSAFTN